MKRIDASWTEVPGFGEGKIGDSLPEWSRRVHPDDLKRMRVAVEAHRAQRTPDRTSEHRVAGKDGSWKWILDRRPVIGRDAEGRPLRMTGTHTDISERKLVEETPRRQNASVRQFNEIAVGRELRTVELKREVNELCVRLGEQPRHNVVAPLPSRTDPDG